MADTGETVHDECSRQTQGYLHCTCPKTSCPRHGLYEACTEYHGSKGTTAYCLRRAEAADKTP